MNYLLARAGAITSVRGPLSQSTSLFLLFIFQFVLTMRLLFSSLLSISSALLYAYIDNKYSLGILVLFAHAVLLVLLGHMGIIFPSIMLLTSVALKFIGNDFGAIICLVLICIHILPPPKEIEEEEKQEDNIPSKPIQTITPLHPLDVNTGSKSLKSSSPTNSNDTPFSPTTMGLRSRNVQQQTENDKAISKTHENNNGSTHKPKSKLEQAREDARRVLEERMNQRSKELLQHKKK
jgi:hypothetical protein